MDALAVERYRYLLAALAAALIVGVVVVPLLARRPPVPELTAHADQDRRQILPHIMLLLVALACGTGLVLLIPAAMILNFFPAWQVRILVLLGIALLGAPLVYAWRSRPFG